MAAVYPTLFKTRDSRVKMLPGVAGGYDAAGKPVRGFMRLAVSAGNGTAVDE